MALDQTLKQIILLNSGCIPAIVEVHKKAFPDSAITRLGTESVRRYYDWLVNGPHPEAFRVGLFVKNELLGFCFGGRFNGATSGFLQKNRSFLAWRVSTHPWLLFNPIFRERITLGFTILHRLRRTQQASIITWSELAKPSFGVLALATHPERQRQGIGKQLMSATEERAREKGFRQMHLTVHPDNQQAVRFYERLGWHKTEEPGDWRGQMVKELV